MSLATLTVAFCPVSSLQAATAFSTAAVSASPDEPISTVSSCEESLVSPPSALALPSSLNPLPPPHPASMSMAAAEAANTPVILFLIVESFHSMFPFAVRTF